MPGRFFAHGPGTLQLARVADCGATWGVQNVHTLSSWRPSLATAHHECHDFVCFAVAVAVTVSRIRREEYDAGMEKEGARWRRWSSKPVWGP